MRKIFIVVMAAVLLGIFAIYGVGTGEKEPVESKPSQPQTGEVQKEPEELPKLLPLEDVVLPSAVTEGRIPEGRYQLPEKVTSMMEWLNNGMIGLLAQQEDVDFYAVEGKENSPALIRWGDSLAEFDWLYATPRAVEPKLWVCDFDGDEETEVIVECYAGSGTGVSLEIIYVVEKEADGKLISHELPWEDLNYLLNRQLQLVTIDGHHYAALGKELVDITDKLPGGKADGVDVVMGYVADYTWTEDGLTCRLGVTAEGGGIALVYVANLEGIIRYEDGVFTLSDMRLLSN